MASDALPSKTAAPCPACGERGRRVSPTTVAAMLRPPRTAPPTAAWSFCRTATCPTVYFGAHHAFTTADVRVVVFQKSADPGRPVCYCFGHTVDAVRADPDLFTAISARCRAGEDDCARRNPQGACCLGNVRMVGRQPTVETPDGGCCGGGG